MEVNLLGVGLEFRGYSHYIQSSPYRFFAPKSHTNSNYLNKNAEKPPFWRFSDKIGPSDWI